MGRGPRQVGPDARHLEVLLDIYNHLLTACADEMVGLQAACERLIGFERYCLAWIGYTLEDGGIQVVATAGERGLASALGAVELRIDEDLPSPVSLAIRDSQAVFMDALPVVEPVPAWARLAHGLEVKAAMAAPIKVLGQTVGAIGVCTRRPDAVAAEELGVLRSVARALGAAVGVARELKAKQEAMDQLRMAGAVFENALEGILITDAEGTILTANQAVMRATGYELHELIGNNPRLFASGRQDADFYSEMWRAIQETGQWRGEIWNRRKCGEIYPEWLSIVAIRDQAGVSTNYVAIFTDITEQKRIESELHRLAFYDNLTGLANRTLFRDRLTHAVAHARRKGERLAVLYLDLDEFKDINDSFGHAAGDHTLKKVAERLSHALRQDDTAARLGGDEFSVLLESLVAPEEAVEVANRILAELSAPLELPAELGGQPLRLTASIGISLYPEDGADPEQLLTHADMAMYHVKQSGRAGFEFYLPDMNRRARVRRALSDEIRLAIARDELVLHYQPKADLDSGRIIGAEALLRWKHPEFGLMYPGEFMSRVEKNDLSILVGEWVLYEAIRQCRLWQDEGLSLSVAINLSGRQFERSDLPRLIGSLLDQWELAPELLELEITETMAMHNLERAVDVLRKLKALGVSIAVDDFGTGYASLSYLKHFPFDTLKLDQSFIRDIENDRGDVAIVRAVVALANSLGRDVIAEGVENRGQLIAVRGCGCRLAQGYLIGRPLPAQGFVREYLGSEASNWRIEKRKSKN